MTGDIPPALLVDYICTSLAVSTRAPKQQRWQRGSLGTNLWGEPVAVWFPATGPVPPPAAWHECVLRERDGKQHRYTFTQGDDGTVHWVELPPPSA